MLDSIINPILDLCGQNSPVTRRKKKKTRARRTYVAMPARRKTATMRGRKTTGRKARRY